MKLLLDHHDLVAGWVAEHIPHVDGFEKMTAIGIMDDQGMPLGAVVYHEYRGWDIQLSCAAETPRWLSKSALDVIFRYPFVQLGCKRVTAMTPLKNAHTRQFLERVGFKQEGILRQGFNEDDCVVYGMLRDECKWVKECRNG